MPNTALLSTSLNMNKFKKGTSNLRSYRNYTKKNKSTASNTNENEIKLILTVPENQLHQTILVINIHRQELYKYQMVLFQMIQIIKSLLTYITDFHLPLLELTLTLVLQQDGMVAVVHFWIL